MIATERDIVILRECGARLARIMRELEGVVRPGLTTLDLDRHAEELILAAGALPVFKGYRTDLDDPAYPASICTSINSEVVHGIPRKDRRLHSGDIIGIDIGMRYPAAGGLISDMATTIGVGVISPAAARLLEVTRQALERGISVARSGIHLGDLGHAIQEHIEQYGFGVVRELVGHGVGKKLHEDPYVPNYGIPGDGMKIPEYAVLAIEPMATLGSSELILGDDGWTWHTRDGSLAAHFEHTVLITREGAEILTRC